VIDAVGEGVDRDRIGEEVVLDPSTSCGACATCARGDVPLCPGFRILGEHRWGTNAELVVVPSVNAVLRPAELPWEDAAAFGLALSSAIRMADRARLRDGESALITGVGGGVSSMALLLCRALGVRAFVTSRDADTIAHALELGAAEGFDSTQPFGGAVVAATGGRGVDVVFENVGPAVWEQAMRSLARGGRIVTNGGTTGRTVELHLPSFFWRQQEVIGSTMNDHEQFRRAVDLVGDGTVPVPIDTVLPFERLPEALGRLEAGAHFGKIVLDHV
jgi:NADPH:quinone reductase-like Zn-dependent oxidoreductase